MLSKRQRTWDPKAVPTAGARLQHHVQDIYGTSSLPASHIQEIMHDLAAAGIHEFKRKTAGGTGNNIARGLRRSLLRNNQWPNPYWAQIRVLAKSGEEKWEWVCFTLPHEYLEVLARLGRIEVMRDVSGLDAVSLAELRAHEAKADAQLIALGLWGDGVPVNWDRTESVDVFSLNFPGAGGQYKGPRLPLVGLSRHLISEHTFHDILEVVTWSLRHCQVGAHPRAMHDRDDWYASDNARAKQAGAPLSANGDAKATLVQTRGEWKYYKEIFNFPAWNTKAGCCWRCRMAPDEA